MSFPQLAGGGGADCGPANPMANLMKQFHQDRSLQQDRFMNAQRGESSKSGFRSNSNIAMQANDRQFTEEFLRDEAPGRMVERPPGAFEFSGLARELESMQAPAAGGDWANEFMQHKPGMHDPNHFEEFEKIYQQHSMHGPAQQHQWHDEFAAFQSNHPGQLEMSQKEREAFEMAFDQAKQEVNWEKEFEAQQADSWAKEFEQQQENSTTSASDKEALARTAAMLLETVDTESNPKFKRSNFMALMHKLRDKEVSIEGNKMVETKGKNAGGDWASEFGQRYEGPSASRSWADDFVQQSGSSTSGNMWKDEFARNAERSWAEDFTMAHNHGESSSAQQQAVPSGGDWAAEFNRATTGGEASQADMEKIFGKGTEMDDWVQQYNENIAHLKTSKDAEWDDMQKDWERFRPEQGLGYRAVNPEYDTYSFMTDNPYLVNPDAIDSVEHTSLADSILALEAKAQLQANDATAWQQLGFRQQENERDGAAIAALRRAVALDPSMLDCWLALAVSYTNENCRADAYDALEQWIMNNEKYQHLARSSGKSRMAADRHAYITNMFLEAARSAPGAEMDADVQVGLGVLFNVSEEYQKAIDCFKAALQSRPQDYMLWNKLGATLANSRDTPGAIEAYFNALEINPSYVRARYNLAISCINLGQNQEAAEHLLTALALQQSAEAGTPAPVMMDDRGNKIPVPSGMSDNIWDSLRMVMFMMNREDLATQCDRRNLDAFRGEFDI